MFLLILERVVFFLFVQITDSCCLFFMFIHSVPSYIQPVTNTFRTARSSAANFGEQFVRFFRDS